MHHISTDREPGESFTHWYLFNDEVYGVFTCAPFSGSTTILDDEGYPLPHGVLTPCQERELREAAEHEA